MTRRLLALSNLLSARFGPRDGRRASPKLVHVFRAALEQRLGFSREESARAAAVCDPALRAHLSTEEAVERACQLVAENFTREDVRHNAQLFLLHPRTLRTRIQVLRELAIERPPVFAAESLFARVLDHSARELRHVGLCSAHARPTLQMALVVAEQAQDSETRQHVLASLQDEHVPLREVRARALALFLVLALHAPEDRARHVASHERVRLLPVTWLASNTRFLREDCRLSSERLLANPALLAVDADNARALLERQPQLFGRETLVTARKYPKLLDTCVSTVEANLRLLEPLFSPQQVASAPQVLTLSRALLETRVHQLLSSPELEPFRRERRALRLVLQLKSALWRLERLRASGRLLATLDQLVGPRKHFERALLGLARRGSLADFLARELQLDWRHVVGHVGRHPLERRFDEENARHVLALLQQLGLSRQHVARGATALLYDAREVARAAERARALGVDARETLGQMCVYLIEKEFAFSGRGVYASRG